MVSVAMVSEGVDIKRLRVLIFLPSAQTELFFRQAIGRVVRTIGDKDITSAYVVMPSLPHFEKFALRIENEMPARFKNLRTNQLKKFVQHVKQNVLSELRLVLNVVTNFMR